MRFVLTALLVLGIMCMAGCGSNEATTTAPVPTSPATTTGVSPSTGEVATTSLSTTSTMPASAELDKYRKAVKKWYDKYTPKMEETITLLDTLADPLDATEDDIKAAKRLAELMKDCASDFEEIKPPTDLASAHGEYLRALQSMATGSQQLYEGLKSKSASSIMDAFFSMNSAAESGEKGLRTLEQALGFPLRNE